MNLSFHNPLGIIERFGFTPISSGGTVSPTVTPTVTPTVGVGFFVMNGLNAGRPGEFWLYNPVTGQSKHVGGLPNEF